MSSVWLKLSALVAGMAIGVSAQAATITKAPDRGPYWNPLSALSSYVYADSFVAPTTGVVTDLGTWFRSGGSEYRLEVLADTGGNGPNGAAILAQTGIQSGTYPTLTYVNFAPTSSTTLIAGQTYWFAASTVGLGGGGGYTAGGHTQNSTYADNGTFWYSNDPAGIGFDGQNNTPEMAFSVTIEGTPVPEPASLALLGMGLLSAVAYRRKHLAS